MKRTGLAFCLLFQSLLLHAHPGHLPYEHEPAHQFSSPDHLIPALTMACLAVAFFLNRLRRRKR